MAVYERKYRHYTGDTTETWSRFLVLPRYAYETVFKSKLFIGFLVLCAIPPLIAALLIYLPHNSQAIKFFEGIGAKDAVFDLLGDFGAPFFRKLFWWQTGFAAVLTFIMGPALISSDLRSNGLPLYLARPFSRVEYVLGKSAVLLILMSAVTWVPGMALFLLQFSFGGFDWLQNNLRTGLAILLGSMTAMLLFNLIALSISAYVKWKPVARVMLLIVLVVFPLFSLLVNLVLSSRVGSLLNIWAMLFRLSDAMFGLEGLLPMPLPLAIFGLIGTALLFLFLLNRKLRAYEVVS